MIQLLFNLRRSGWEIAVHNDYRQEGKHFTFWLFTHKNGRWVKGEGHDDEEALRQATAAADMLTAESWAANDRANDEARIEVLRKQAERELQRERDEAVQALAVATATEAAVRSTAIKAFAAELERLRGVVKQLRDALPPPAMAARNGEPNWDLSRLTALYMDPAGGRDPDYVTENIEPNVILAARASADLVLS